VSSKNKALRQENMQLLRENSSLRSQISDLQRDIRLVYQSTREFLKEHTNGLKAFKNVCKGLVDKIKDKTSQTQEKLKLESKMNESEKVHKEEMTKERDRGLELKKKHLERCFFCVLSVAKNEFFLFLIHIEI